MTAEDVKKPRSPTAWVHTSEWPVRVIIPDGRHGQIEERGDGESFVRLDNGHAIWATHSSLKPETPQTNRVRPHVPWCEEHGPNRPGSFGTCLACAVEKLERHLGAIARMVDPTAEPYDGDVLTGYDCDFDGDQVVRLVKEALGLVPVSKKLQMSEALPGFLTRLESRSAALPEKWRTTKAKVERTFEHVPWNATVLAHLLDMTVLETIKACEAAHAAGIPWREIDPDNPPIPRTQEVQSGLRCAKCGAYQTCFNCGRNR